MVEQLNKSAEDQSGCTGCGNGCGAPPEFKDQISRTQFMNGIVGTFAGLWALMAAYPIYRYLTPKPSDVEGASKVSSVVAGDVKDLPVGTGKNFRFGSTPGILVHTKDGQFHAYNAICTHLGCTVQYREDSNQIWCACHGGCYDPDTGKNVAGPPPKPLTALKIEIKDNKIVVSHA